MHRLRHEPRDRLPVDDKLSAHERMRAVPKPREHNPRRELKRERVIHRGLPLSERHELSRQDGPQRIRFQSKGIPAAEAG